MPESGAQPNGNIEIHSREEREVIFVPGTEWNVNTGYRFEFTRQGNLEVHNPSGALLWESATRSQGGNKLSFQPDGDLGIYKNGRPTPLWSANTKGNKGAFLAFQSDGNLVIYSANRQPIWATATNE